jgi:putative DNA primase/helicase
MTTARAFDPGAVPPADDPLADAAQMDPEPFVSEMPAARPYPLDALPEPMRAAVLEYQAFGKQPVALIATSALSALSLAAQHLADVARGSELSGPTSLNTLTVAISGERKTSADRALTSGLRQLEETWRARAVRDGAKHKVAMESFRIHREVLVGSLKEARKKTGAKKGVDSIERAIEDLDMTEPSAPPERILFHSDSTAERLAIDLALGWPSASVWSDEGGIIVGGHSMRPDTAMATIALHNKLWDGATYRRRRAKAESCEIRGKRVTCAIMVQPIVFAHLATLAGGAVRGMGLFARYLLAWPVSTIGTRLYEAPTPGLPALRTYHKRLVELASIEPEFPRDDRGLIVYELHPPTLDLSPAAFEAWVSFHNDVERELVDSGAFEDVRDVASKIADNAARIACLLHVFAHGPEGAISAEHMRSGTALGAWHLYEAQRVFGLAKQSAVTEAALILLRWALELKGDLFGPRDVQRGPRALRDDGKLRAKALDLLVEKFWISSTLVQGVELYRLHPQARVFAKKFELV